MKIKKIGIISFVVAVLLTSALFAVKGGTDSHEGHDHGTEMDAESHEGHDHEAEMETDSHEGHDQEAEMGAESHDDHDHEAEMESDSHEGHEHSTHSDLVELSEAAMELGGIEFDTARKGVINRIIELPGEVDFNRDRLVHITPRFGGVVRDVAVNAGQRVEKGQTLATVESNESMSRYEIKSPQSGYIVERNVAPGEFAGEDRSIFVIADLSSVWIELAVYSKDEAMIQNGLEVEIDAVGADQTTTGRISYISRFYSRDTRRLTARVVLPNPGNRWKPGSFVKGHVAVKSGGERLLVANEAVQIVNQKPAVFLVRSSNSFEPVNVQTGLKGERYTEILSDNLKPGDRYVSQGAFEIKAHLVTSSLDAHAGHGH